MSRELLEKWSDAAALVPKVRTSFNPPIPVLLNEAFDLEPVTHTDLEPVRGASARVLRPGIALAGTRILTAIGADILELQSALHTAQLDYLMTVAPNQPNVRARAEYVLDEIATALEWLLNDGASDAYYQQLTTLKAKHVNSSTNATLLAAGLVDYAACARRWVRGLHDLGGFDLTLLDEAEGLARRLHEPTAAYGVPEITRLAADLRNRIATLLLDRMNFVRTALRSVHHDCPEFARCG